MTVDDRTNRLDAQVSLRPDNELTPHNWTLTTIFCDELSTFTPEARIELGVRLSRLIRGARAAPSAEDHALPEDAALVRQLARRAGLAASRVLVMLDGLPPEELPAALVREK